MKTIKRYQVKMKVLSSVHIGEGEDIKKYEYIDGEDAIYVINQRKLIDLLNSYGKDSFEKYLNFIEKAPSNRRNQDNSLYDFLLDRIILDANTFHKLIPDITDYKLYYQNEESAENLNDISLTQKDKLTKRPYIPGSSLKGAIRNALVASYMSAKYHNLPANKNALKEALKEVEKLFFPKKRDDIKDFDMKGVAISDSNLIDSENLNVGHIYYYNLKSKKEKTLPVLAELIKKDTKITFNMTINPNHTKITIDDIKKAIKDFNQMYNNYYLSKFGRERIATPEAPLKLYIGKHSGFPTKTIIYSALKDRAGLYTSQFLKEQFKDGRTVQGNYYNNISPVCLKCVNISNQKYENGATSIEIEEM